MALDTDMIYEAPVRYRRGQCLSPLTAPPLVMVLYYLFGSYRIWGEPKRRG
jgi:hypothetical protein